MQSIALSLALQIIWDKTTNQWLNKDEVGGNGNAASIPPPPPKLSDMSYRTPTMEYNSQPPLPGAHNEDASAMDVSTSIAGCNKYKMSKSRSMRKKYVDVMNPDGNASSNIPTSNVRSPMPVPMATSSPHFNPAPSKLSPTMFGLSMFYLISQIFRKSLKFSQILSARCFII